MILGNPLGPRESRILIEDSVIANVGAFRQVEPSAVEAGGILLGFRRDTHLHVAIATPPGPLDRRRKFHFYRDVQFHAEIALSQWAKTQETMDYIGEWHTHPEDRPQPSALDLQEWRQICRRRNEPMVFMIQGILGRWIGVGLGRNIKVSAPK
jgi:integrative and conjugative element protein (TIGR02256 family)